MAKGAERGGGGTGARARQAPAPGCRARTPASASATPRVMAHAAAPQKPGASRVEVQMDITRVSREQN